MSAIVAATVGQKVTADDRRVRLGPDRHPKRWGVIETVAEIVAVDGQEQRSPHDLRTMDAGLR